MGNFGQALCIRSCHEDPILTRKSHNCAGVRSKFLGGEGVVDGEGGSSEGWLKWGGGGWGVIKGSFQKRLKAGGG